MGPSSAIAADTAEAPEPTSDKQSGHLLAFWGATGSLYLTLIWLYWRSFVFQPLALEDQARLQNLGHLPLFGALLHAAGEPLRPGDNLLFWLIAQGDRLVVWRAALLGVFLLTTAFVQYYSSERGESWIVGVCSAWCFALNPTSASVVCWLAGAHVGLCALGVLGYAHCAQRLLDRGDQGSGRILLWVGALGGLAFALAFYELAVLAPLLLVLYCALLKPPAAAGTARRLYAGSAACVASYLVLQFAANAGAKDWFGRSAGLRAAGTLRYYMENFMLWMWPWGRFGVAVPDAPAGHALANALCALLVVSSWAVLWKLRRWDPTSAFGFAWFVLFLIPAFVLPQPIAQYHLYLPMLGFVFAGGRMTLWVLERISASIAKPRLRLCFDVGVALFFLWSFVPLLDETVRVVEAWGDEEQLYLLTLQNYPQNSEVLGRFSQLYPARKPAAANAPAERGSWEPLLDELLMRPIREPASTLIRQGRELAGQGRDAEGGSAFARALAAGTTADERLAAGTGLAHALVRLDQPANAAALLERLRSEYPTRPPR